MENVESDPKTDRPKVCVPQENRGCSSGWAGQAWGPVSCQPCSRVPFAVGGDPHRLHHGVCGPLRGGRCSGEESGPMGRASGSPVQPEGLRVSHIPLHHRSLRSGRRHSSWRQPPKAQRRKASPSLGARAPQHTARGWASTSTRQPREWGGAGVRFQGASMCLPIGD